MMNEKTGSFLTPLQSSIIRIGIYASILSLNPARPISPKTISKNAGGSGTPDYYEGFGSKELAASLLIEPPMADVPA